jgi:hypothetical protein
MAKDNTNFGETGHRARGFVREIGGQMFATFGTTLAASRTEISVRTGTTCGS